MNSIKILGLVNSKALKESKDGIIPFVLTTKTVDRDSEVVLPDGIDLEEFKQNPVFLWAHDFKTRPPLGKILIDTISQSSEELKADVEFDMNDPFAAMVYHKYKKGYLNAGSIRFIAKELKPPFMQGQKGHTISKSQLLEFSAAPIPANPEALSQNQKYLEELEGEISIQKQFAGEIAKFSDPDFYKAELSQSQEIYVKQISVSQKAESSESAVQKESIAVFHAYKKQIPEDAILLECSDEGMSEVKHPYAGKSLNIVDVTFHPPMNVAMDKIYSISMWRTDDNLSDEDLLKSYLNSQVDISFSEKVLSIFPDSKGISGFSDGFLSDMPLKDVLSEKIVSLITKEIREYSDLKKASLTLDEAVDQMQKILSDDPEFLVFIKQSHYLTLAKVYEKNGKVAPEFRASNEKNLSNPQDGKKFTKEQTEQIIQIAGEIAKRTFKDI